MKKLLVALLLGIPLIAAAEIYKCKDSHQKLVYQDTPCEGKPVGKLAPLPPLSQVDEQRARERLDRLLEENRYYDRKYREEAQLQAEERRRQEIREERERELAAAEAAREASSVYIPVYGPGYPYGRHRNRGHVPPVITPVKPQPSRPCVIGYVGDRSCR
jgi:hypothetical protein